MKAIVQDRYGTPDVLKLREIDTPAIGDDDVLVRVRAAAVNIGDWHLVRGMPYLIRVMGFGLRRPKNRVPGTDIAGRVEAVGRNVRWLQTGDEVVGWCNGAFAEYACARESNFVLRPTSLTDEQAAALGGSSFTALQGLRDHGQVKPRQKVLIIGAAGSVGTFAVQIAKAFGAEVTGVCSTTKIDLVRSIGADHAIDYTQEDFTESSKRYDLILDTAGNRPLSRLRRALTDDGTLVIIGGEEGGRLIAGTDRQLRALVLSPFVGQKLRTFVSKPTHADLVVLTEFVDAGEVTPVIDRTFPLRETSEAIQYVGAGRARGKTVVTVSGTTP